MTDLHGFACMAGAGADSNGSGPRDPSLAENPAASAGLHVPSQQREALQNVPLNSAYGCKHGVERTSNGDELPAVKHASPPVSTVSANTLSPASPRSLSKLLTGMPPEFFDNQEAQAAASQGRPRAAVIQAGAGAPSEQPPTFSHAPGPEGAGMPTGSYYAPVHVQASQEAPSKLRRTDVLPDHAGAALTSEHAAPALAPELHDRFQPAAQDHPQQPTWQQHHLQHRAEPPRFVQPMRALEYLQQTRGLTLPSPAYLPQLQRATLLPNAAPHVQAALHQMVPVDQSDLLVRIASAAPAQLLVSSCPMSRWLPC